MFIAFLVSMDGNKHELKEHLTAKTKVFVHVCAIKHGDVQQIVPFDKRRVPWRPDTGEPITGASEKSPLSCVSWKDLATPKERSNWSNCQNQWVELPKSMGRQLLDFDPCPSGRNLLGLPAGPSMTQKSPIHHEGVPPLPCAVLGHGLRISFLSFLCRRKGSPNDWKIGIWSSKIVEDVDLWLMYIKPRRCVCVCVCVIATNCWFVIFVVDI